MSLFGTVSEKNGNFGRDSHNFSTTGI